MKHQLWLFLINLFLLLIHSNALAIPIDSPLYAQRKQIYRLIFLITFFTSMSLLIITRTLYERKYSLELII